MWLRVAVSVCLLLSISSGVLDAAEEKGGKVIPANLMVEMDCSVCHGERGEGRAELKGPALAGLPEWYLEAQLKKFRKHARGIDPEDKSSVQMHAMAVVMKDEEIARISRLISQFKRMPSAQTVFGNALRGKSLFSAQCVSCHGPDAMGIKTQNAPPLVGYQDWYLKSQIEKFRRGSRGVHPLDTEGIEMHKVAKKLAGDQDIRDLVAFIADLAEK